MPLVIAIGVACQYIIKYAITKVLLVLGLGFVSYLGVDSLVDNIEAQLMSNYGSLESTMWNMASLCGLDVSITILVSALALSLQIKMIVAGAKFLTRLGR